MKLLVKFMKKHFQDIFLDDRRYIIKTEDVELKINSKGCGYHLFECLKKNHNKTMQVIATYCRLLTQCYKFYKFKIIHIFFKNLQFK